MKFRIVDSLDSISVVLRDVLDKTQKNALNPKLGIKCFNKCSGCCYRKISITLAEAMLIRDFCVRKGSFESVLSRARQLSEISPGVDSFSWFLMRQPCPLLMNGACSAYAVRPPVCAVHYAKSDPDGCDPHNTRPIEYEPWTDSEQATRWFQESNRMLSPNLLGLTLPLPNALVVADVIAEKDIEDIEHYIISMGKIK